MTGRGRGMADGGLGLDVGEVLDAVMGGARVQGPFEPGNGNGIGALEGGGNGQVEFAAKGFGQELREVAPAAERRTMGGAVGEAEEGDGGAIVESDALRLRAKIESPGEDCREGEEEQGEKDGAALFVHEWRRYFGGKKGEMEGGIRGLRGSG